MGDRKKMRAGRRRSEMLRPEGRKHGRKSTHMEHTISIIDSTSVYRYGKTA